MAPLDNIIDSYLKFKSKTKTILPKSIQNSFKNISAIYWNSTEVYIQTIQKFNLHYHQHIRNDTCQKLNRNWKLFT